jgi:hypothetical protein
MASSDLALGPADTTADRGSVLPSGGVHEELLTGSISAGVCNYLSILPDSRLLQMSWCLDVTEAQNFGTNL